MIRFLLRFIGLLVLALAFVTLVIDGARSIANQRVVYYTLAEDWAIVDQTSLNQVEALIKQKAAWAWTPYMEGFFALPVWSVLTILAMILIVLGRKKKPLIGYARN